ncbi:MAG TPA: GAF domain-containing protein [Candidatus Limnocylindrales bacterium]|nr:GAF domain-containing protein [Candidatus Limnocylindrales bacterium]
MTAPSRPRPTRKPRAASSAPASTPPRRRGDPDGGAGVLHGLLIAAVDETARLLDADGAMVYLVDPATGNLRFAHDAGIKKARTREWIRAIQLAPGVGMFGRAVADRAVVTTTDYRADASFRHAASADRVVDDLGIRSMVVAPLAAGDEVFGALGAFSKRQDAFDAAQIALVRSLAEHAASAMANTRLIEELDRSRQELDRSRNHLARRAAADQALRELAARITALRDPAEILQEVVELASRLVGGEGAILDLLDPDTGDLRWAYDDGLRRWFSAEERAKLWISVGEGATGVAVAEDRVVVAGDDLASLFPPGPENTEFYARTGFRSMIAAPITGEHGPLGVIEVYAVRPDAFDEADAALIRALAGQAAIAITNARLIAELAESRAALERTAEAERTLREIAASVTAMRDKDEILQAVVEAATRLLRSSGAMIDLIDPTDAAGGASRHTDNRLEYDEKFLTEVQLTPDAGVSGLTLRTGKVESSGDYLADRRFEHTPERDAFVLAGGIKSVMAAPLLRRGEVIGAVTVYSERPDGFDEQDGAVLAGLAGQAAVAIANVRLIADLERSREENARRADAERTLREIAVRVSSILDPTEVLDRIVVEAARLLESDGSRIDLWDEESGSLMWAYSAGDAMRDVPDWGRSGGIKPGQAVAGLAFAEQRPQMTADLLADDRFQTTPGIERFIRDAGIRAVIAVPLTGEDARPLGVLSVVSRELGAYSDSHVETLTALATHASIAIVNANLMEALARSQSDIERRAEAERSLRQIAARINALREPDEVLQDVVDEARRLLRADGAVIDQYDPQREALLWAYDAGLPEAQREALKRNSLRVGKGVAGKAVAERRPVHVGDYSSAEFEHDDLTDSLAELARVRDLIAVPILGEAGPLGAIEVISHEPNAFDELDAAVLGGLAEQAAIAITNARLIDELKRSQLALARRAETERSLRDITARIAALRDPDEVLERVVEDAKRLLESDGAHLTRMAPAGDYLIPVVVAGGVGPEARDWLLGMRFPLGGGINGLAAQSGVPVWTSEYLTDPRIPHEPDDQQVARRMGLVGMAAAPLRAPGGEVIGTLAISTAQPRAFEADDLDLLQGLADQAAIALTNSNLLWRVTQEEARFRGLVQTTPDVIWRADTEGVFTFMADSGEALFGWPVDRIIGEHFGFLTEPDSMPTALVAYEAVSRDPDLVERVPLTLVRQDGSSFAAEVTTAGVFEDGRWVGAQGTVRDVSERARLERELRASEERYRYLVQNAPDLIWSIGPDARLTFLSAAVERLTGFRPEELLGQHFGALVHESSSEVAEIDWTAALVRPSQEVRGRLNLRHRDGSAVPAEFIALATLDDAGRFAGANGSVRDMRDHDRLERDLRASEDRYRNLASSSPDMVFATDAEGRYTFLSDRASTMLGWDLERSLGRPFMDFIAPGWEAAAAASYEAVLAHPTSVHSVRIDFLDGAGAARALEINVLGKVEDGVLVGINGVARDISERLRLERELSQSEERFRFLVQNSPDIVFSTDAEGRFTFLSDAIERVTGHRADDVIGQHFSVIIDQTTIPVAGNRWAELVAHPDREQQAALVLRGVDGRRVPVDVRAIGITDGDAFAGIQGATRDVSDQVRLENELRRQAGELAAGEERAHLARELHDSVTQALFSMTLVSRSVEMLLERDPDAAREQLSQLRELQREALAEMRALIFELRPGNLEQEGLSRALKTHAAALQGRLGLPIVVDSELPDRLPLPAEEVLYRIAQEALHNVVKHAAAHRVRVEVRRLDGGVRLRVEDDGRGFDQTRVPEGHLGLAGMRARAERVGAQFVCTSESGSGTTIEVTMDQSVLERLAASTSAPRVPSHDEVTSIRDG